MYHLNYHRCARLKPDELRLSLSDIANWPTLAIRHDQLQARRLRIEEISNAIAGTAWLLLLITFILSLYSLNSENSVFSTKAGHRYFLFLAGLTCVIVCCAICNFIAERLFDFLSLHTRVGASASGHPAHRQFGYSVPSVFVDMLPIRERFRLLLIYTVVFPILLPFRVYILVQRGLEAMIHSVRALVQAKPALKKSVAIEMA